MTPKPKPNVKHPTQKATPEDEHWDTWVEEEGRKLTDEEFQELLKKAPVIDRPSKTLEEFAAEHGIDLNEANDED